MSSCARRPAVRTSAANPQTFAVGLTCLLFSAKTSLSHSIPDNLNFHLHTQTCETQTLNLIRIIIDRSILLLLSASKCCLRQNEEFQRGFEARRCVVAQIRASVSIIMAVVKCSVFQHNGRLEAGASEATPIQQHCSALTESSTTCSNSNSAHNNNANTNNASAPQRDNQFDYSCLGACQSAFSAPESASWLSKFHQEQLLKSITSANGNLTRRQNCNAQMSSNANANTNFNANCAPSGDLEFCSQTNKQTTSCQEAASLSAKIASASVRLKQLNAAESSLQIMNYFLQTWNGTQSAHDAINKLLVSCR